MSEAVWYIYQNSSQSGPFSQEEIQKRLHSKMISQDAYLYKVGWKDWQPLEDAQAELGVAAAAPVPTPNMKKQRLDRAPRATIDGQVIVHNDGQLSIGSGVNISATGMFVETDQTFFKVGEQLKVTCRADGHLLKPFNVTAKVMRHANDRRSPVGYGLQFVNLDPKIRKEIQDIIDKENARRA